MSGRQSRDKGARGEREAARVLSEYGIPSERAARNGKHAGDLVHPLELVHIEVKYQARCDLWAAMRQAAAQAGPQFMCPLVLANKIHRGGSSGWMVMHQLSDWYSISKAVMRVWDEQDA